MYFLIYWNLYLIFKPTKNEVYLYATQLKTLLLQIQSFRVTWPNVVNFYGHNENDQIKGVCPASGGEIWGVQSILRSTDLEW